MQVIFDHHGKVEKASDGFRLSIENVLQVGFDLFRKSPGIFIIYGVISAITFSNPISGALLGGPLTAGFYIVAHRLSRNQPVELTDFFRSFDKFTPLLILNLLIGVLVFLGLLLLVIPGIYFAVSYLFAHFFVWFHDENPTDAIRLSRKMVSGNFGQVLLLSLVLGGINLLGVIAFGVGILLTLPYTFCVLYAAFDDIVGIPSSE